jgi:2-desacetyl-2-hydroxyethyl bacteriochlorophyllide A dehydrogenase
LKAKAIVFREAGKPALEEPSLPKLQKGQVLVKIHYSGVSIGTESSIFMGERTHNGTFPLISGYMAAGEVAETAPDVKNFKAGDLVASFGTKVEGDVNSVWGAHCSYHVTGEESLSPVPAGLDLRDASMHIMPCVGLSAVEMANITDADTVFISGQGLIGQFCGQWAASRGARVITAEPDPLRAGLSKKYVTDNVLNPLECDLGKELDRLTDGAWPTVLVEATANKKLIPQTTGFIRRMHARMVFLSWYPGEITLDYSHFHNWEATAFFPMGGGQHKRAVLEGLARGVIKMGDNITDVYEFAGAPAGFKRICDRDRSIMGMVIDWRNA